MLKNNDLDFGQKLLALLEKKTKMKLKTLLPSMKLEVEKPFEEKLERSEQLCKTFTSLFPKRCFISCSFGKDSITVLYIIRKYLPEIPVLFNNTGVQYSETYDFRRSLTKQWQLNLVETKPIKSFWNVAEKYGLPDGKKKSDRCCDYLKEIPLRNEIKKNGWEVNFTGITIMESRVRMFTVCQRGQYYYSRKDGVLKIHPIAFWTEDEVWNFIRKNQIPVNPAYEKYKIDRLGCVPCTSHKFWRRQLAKTNPKMYKFIQERFFHQKLLELGKND